jgi:hypothetical protein
MTGNCSGFGELMTGGVQYPYDGNIRGWTTRVRRMGSPDLTWSSSYAGLDFSGINDGALPGGGWHGDSGGGVRNNASGQTVAMVVGSQGSTTYALSIDAVSSWAGSIIAAEQPRILAITPQGNDIQISWRAAPGSNYFVQASSNLADPNSFTNISQQITFTNSTSGTLNYVDQGVLTNCPARFYRIQKVVN